MIDVYRAAQDRYEKMKYNRCGGSGLKLPRLSLGMWHNFGSVDRYQDVRQIVFHAFDCGITHFDLANNYGPEYGSAEENFGRILRDGLGHYRDQLIISTKAGYEMWPGPYGNGGSRKYMLASLDQSLKRMGIDYVDIFYSHRPDPETPIEETMSALTDAVRYGKAIYVGISNYDDEQSRRAIEILRRNGTPCLIHQARYSMLDRWVEPRLLDVLEENGVGLIAFSPLAQGLLTNRYLDGIPADSRVMRNGFLKKEALTPAVLAKVRKLNEIASGRGQTLAEMAIAWLLNRPGVTSALIGASRPEQIRDVVAGLAKLDFSEAELARIEAILAE